jgi:hypothetical protein
MDATSGNERGPGPQFPGVVAIGEQRLTRQIHHIDGAGEPPQLQRGVRFGAHTLGKRLELRCGNQHLEGCRHITQPGGQVHCRTDVVVTLEQQGKPGGQAYPQRQRRARSRRPAFQFQRKGDGIGLLDRYDHATVTQPFGDSDTPFRGDFTRHGAKRTEQSPRSVVASDCGVVRETRQVHEGEGPRYAHRSYITTRLGLRGAVANDLG